jgi:multidrug efflux pump subunit AcrA (membrane-fusion protein)
MEKASTLMEIKNKPKKISRFFKHKKSIIFILLILGLAGFFYFKNKNGSATETSYSLSVAQKDSIISTISGSGQVSALNQVDIKPKISSDKEGTTNIIEINVKTGQEVKEGDVLARIDSENLKLQVKNAKNSLDVAKNNLALKLAGSTEEEIEISKKSVESSKLSYESAVKNLETIKNNLAETLRKSELSVTNAQMSLENSQRDYDNAVSSAGINSSSNEQDISNTYNTAKNNLNSTYTSLRSALVVADSILGMNNYSSNLISYSRLLGTRDSQSVSNAQNSYYQAKGDFESFESSYKGKTEFTNEEIEQFLNSVSTSLESMKTLESDVYSMLLNSVASTDLSQSTIDGYKSSVSSQESAMISGLSNILSSLKSISSINLNSS